MARSYQDCIRDIKAAAGDKLSAKEVEGILGALEAQRERFTREGDLIGIEDKIRQFAADQAKEKQFQAAIKRRGAMISAMKREKLVKQVKERVLSGKIKAANAVKAFINGRDNPVEGVRASADSFAQAAFRKYGDLWIKRISKEKPYLLDFARQTFLGRHAPEFVEFDARVELEMEAIKNGQTTGVTGDRDAAWLAKLYYDLSEVIRRDVIRNGGWIGKLDGWTPRAWHADELIAFGKARWVLAVQEQLDPIRSFPGKNPAEVAEILENIYETITVGRDKNNAKGEVMVSSGSGTNSMVTLLSGHRELHFKPGGYRAVREAMGSQTTLTQAMFSHMASYARHVGHMEMFGPNPELQVMNLAEAAKQAVRELVRRGDMTRQQADKEIEKLSKIMDSASVKVLAGEAFSPHNARFARAGQSFRNIESMRTLSGLLLAQINEPLTIALNMRYQGVPLPKALAQTVREYARQAGWRATRRFGDDAAKAKLQAEHQMYLAGEGIDQFLDGLTSPYFSMEGPTGAFSRATQIFFRLTGSGFFHDVGRSAYSRIMAADLGHHADVAFDDLRPELRDVFLKQGMTAQKWEAWRKGSWEGANGKRYVTPDSVRNLTDEDILPLAKERLELLEKGLADRTAKRLEANAREAAWVRKRLDKHRDELLASKARHEERLAKKTDKASAQADKFTQRLSKVYDRLDNIAEFYSTTKQRGFQAGYDTATGKKQVKKLERELQRLRDDASAQTEAMGAEWTSRWHKRAAKLQDFVDRMKSNAEARAKDSGGDLTRHANRVAEILRSIRDELEMDAYRFFSDEVNKGIVKVSDRARAVTTQGMAPGTYWGEAARFFMQLKTWPIAFTQEVLGRQAAGRIVDTGQSYERATNIGVILATLAVGGMVSMWLKDIAKGNTPKGWKDLAGFMSGEDYDGKRIWGAMIAGMLQGGGMGIYGDFIFAKENRFGQGRIETMAGPGVSTIGMGLDTLLGLTQYLQGKELTGENLEDDFRPALKWGISMLSTNPIVPVKMATDILFADALKNALMPKSQEASLRILEEEYGQTKIFGAD